MKKRMMTTMLAALLVLPLGGVAQAQTPEAIQPEQSAVAAETLVYTHGEAPAEINALESMTPAIHGMVLSVLSQESGRFDLTDSVQSWEALYNMLSLYGQMDDRSDYVGEELLLPAEAVVDFSAALTADFSALGELPAELSDRMVYDAQHDGYLLTCGSDDLAQIHLDAVQSSGGSLTVSGALTYLVDGEDLARFEATLQPADNLFGYIITGLELL